MAFAFCNCPIIYALVSGCVGSERKGAPVTVLIRNVIIIIIQQYYIS